MSSARRGEPQGHLDQRGSAEPGRILIVEDDESVALTLCGILEAEGHEVALAPTVPEALAHLERDRIAAALIDLRLADADGLTILPILKARWPGAVGIVLTGHGPLETAVQAMRAGADDFLLKPADVAELKASIARAIHWRARMDQRASELDQAKESHR